MADNCRQLYEAIADEVCNLDRPELVRQLTHFNGPLKLDFTPEFLDTCSTERMRHMLVAALWRCRSKQLSAA